VAVAFVPERLPSFPSANIGRKNIIRPFGTRKSFWPFVDGHTVPSRRFITSYTEYFRVIAEGNHIGGAPRNFPPGKTSNAAAAFRLRATAVGRTHFRVVYAYTGDRARGADVFPRRCYRILYGTRFANPAVRRPNKLAGRRRRFLQKNRSRACSRRSYFEYFAFS